MTFTNVSFLSWPTCLSAEIKAAFVVECSGGAKRFDANLQPHHHFRCVRRKRIVDFYHQPFDNIEVSVSIRLKVKVLRKPSISKEYAIPVGIKINRCLGLELYLLEM